MCCGEENKYPLLVTKSRTQDTPIVPRQRGSWGKNFWLWRERPVVIPGAPWKDSKSFPWVNGYIELQADTQIVVLIRIESNSDKEKSPTDSFQFFWL